jgi:photosystem II stability/assembly factor-like uncharacterized protein
MKIRLLLSSIVVLAINTGAFAQWIEQTSGVTARLRGLSAVSNQIAWASGSGGACLRTIDGGKTWLKLTLPGAESLDFRDIEAFDANTAYVLSIGEGDKSRIYKTTDGGKSWTLQFTNRNPNAFFDAIAFWDRNNGLAISDPVDGRFVVIRTTDGGGHWTQVPPENVPPALPNEGAFAASGTCLTAYGGRHAWFGTGGAAKARVFRSTDKGLTWQVSETPLAAGVASAGIFSVAFHDQLRGVIVGGDYRKEKEAVDNVAVTDDGGRTWILVKDSGLTGFRSGVGLTFINAQFVVKDAVSVLTLAVGPSGSEYSRDGGRSWSRFDDKGYDTVSFARRGNAGWASGANGRIARFSPDSRRTR